MTCEEGGLFHELIMYAVKRRTLEYLLGLRDLTLLTIPFRKAPAPRVCCFVGKASV